MKTPDGSLRNGITLMEDFALHGSEGGNLTLRSSSRWNKRCRASPKFSTVRPSPPPSRRTGSRYGARRASCWRAAATCAWSCICCAPTCRCTASRAWRHEIADGDAELVINCTAGGQGQSRRPGSVPPLQHGLGFGKEARVSASIATRSRLWRPVAARPVSVPPLQHGLGFGGRWQARVVSAYVWFADASPLTHRPNRQPRFAWNMRHDAGVKRAHLMHAGSDAPATARVAL